MADKSKVLVIGGTGYIGKFIVKESITSGHPTFVLVRETNPSDPSKSKLLVDFKNSGVTLLEGDVHDGASLVKAIKQVDVVISTVGSFHIPDQIKIVEAIKVAGNIKRFLPSEFGTDVDRVHAVEPAKSAFASKVNIRRATEAAGIPHTYISCNFFAGYFLPSFSQPGASQPPREKVQVLGDGNAKAVYVKEEDIARFALKAIDDPRAINKILYIRPPGNVYSFNELISLWEQKIGKSIEKCYIPEEEILKKIEEATSLPAKFALSIGHSVFVKGDQTNFEIEASFGVEASQLYPDVKYTTVSDYLDQFV